MKKLLTVLFFVQVYAFGLAGESRILLDINNFIPSGDGKYVPIMNRVGTAFVDRSAEGFIAENFVSRRVPFILVDGRFYRESKLYLFYQESGVVYKNDTSIVLCPVAEQAGTLWWECLRGGYAISRNKYLENRDASTGPLSVAFLTAYDGSEFSYSTFWGNEGFSIEEVRNDSELAFHGLSKYLDFSRLLKTLMCISNFKDSKFWLIAAFPLKTDQEVYLKEVVGEVHHTSQPKHGEAHPCAK